MDYFQPRQQHPVNNRFSYDNRQQSAPYRDRDNRFRRDNNYQRPQFSFNFRNAQHLLPAPDNILYAVQDKIDPNSINYTFYDLPAHCTHPQQKQEIKPNLEFAEFTNIMPSYLQRSIIRLKYQKLTPIQQYVIPILKEGCDVLATAQTGSGKSAAFLIPIFLKIQDSQFKKLTNSPTSYCNATRAVAQPFVIILSPTRELALQNANASWQLSNGSGIITRVIFGGDPIGTQKMVTQAGCDILVATPGRLMDFLKQGIVDFRYIKFFILDEADVMLDMGFIDDIKEIRKTIMEAAKLRTPEQNTLIGELQTSMFSATFPKEIRSIANEFLSQPYHVSIGEIGVTGKNITQVLLKTTNSSKMDFLKYLAGKQGQMLIFCQTKAGVDMMVNQLKFEFINKTNNNVSESIKDQVDQMFGYLKRTVEESTPQNEKAQQQQSSVQYFQQVDTEMNPDQIAALHGDLSQNERMFNLNRFKSAQLKILVATDVAQRGLDLPKVDYVVNYDMPKNIEDYSHRIGRTGRAGRRGCSITLVTENESKSIMKELLNKLVECEQLVPAWYDDMLRTKWVQDIDYNGRRSHSNQFNRYRPRDQNQGQYRDERPRRGAW